MALIHVELLIKVRDEEIDFPLSSCIITKLFDWYDQPQLDKFEVKIDGSLV